MEWETAETVPEHVWHDFVKANMLIPSLPAPLPVAWLKKLGIHDILGVVKVEEWDYLHMAIYSDEVSAANELLLRLQSELAAMLHEKSFLVSGTNSFNHRCHDPVFRAHQAP